MSITNIIEELSPQESIKSTVKASISSNKLETGFFILTIFTIVLTITISTFPNLQADHPNLIGWTLLISYALLLISMILSAITSILPFLINPSNELIKNIAEHSEEQYSLVHRIATHPSHKINFTLERIEFDILRIKARMGFLTGATEKLGVIPVLIGFYISLVKLIEDKNFDSIPHIDILLSFTCGVYIGAIAIIKVLTRLEYMRLVLKQAKELAEEREELLKNK